jgi:hypothetical protein
MFERVHPEMGVLMPVQENRIVMINIAVNELDQ